MKVWEILKTVGAVKNSTDDYQICHLHIPLPYSMYCAKIWRTEKPYDVGRNDLRNNMIGATHAEIILMMDKVVTTMKRAATFMPRDILAELEHDELLEFIQDYNVSEADITMEYNLTYHAPISKDFPPPASVIPLVTTGSDEL